MTTLAEPAAPSILALSVVVVNYNGRRDLSDCLSSLLHTASNSSSEIVVVDNASTDGSSDIASQHQGVKVIRSPQNVGYAAAVNLALPRLRGRYVAVLNMDLVVSADWSKPLIAFLDQRQEVGAVCPLLLLHEAQDRVNAVGQSVHVTGLGFNRALGQKKAQIGPDPVRLSGIQGGAFVIRKNLLEQMGGWDASGFLYHEDVQLSWQLHVMGYAMYCIPSATVYHKYRLSMYPEKFYLLERNRLLLLLTHTKLITRLLLSPLLLLTELMAWGFSLWRGPDFVKAKTRSYRDVLARKHWMHRRRKEIDQLRQRSDMTVLSQLDWNYHWGQFATLAQEKLSGGPSRVRG